MNEEIKKLIRIFVYFGEEGIAPATSYFSIKRTELLANVLKENGFEDVAEKVVRSGEIMSKLADTDAMLKFDSLSCSHCWAKIDLDDVNEFSNKEEQDLFKELDELRESAPTHEMIEKFKLGDDFFVNYHPDDDDYSDMFEDEDEDEEEMENESN